jgi:hypothetical protein
MRRAMRLVLAFVLAAAIPLQSMAAATMALCGPVHSSIRSADALMTLHHPGAESHHHGHQLHQHASGSPDVQRHLHHADAGPDKLSKSKCSVCASCCFGAAMPSPALVFNSVVTTEFFAPAVSIDAPAFVTAGPERPPRTFLA